jgi:MFS transporter, DHA2 family, multidrug resistance protein
VAMLAGTRLQSPRRANPAAGPIATPKALVTVGFAIMAVGLLVGTGTGTGTGSGFVAVWFALAGLGLGLAMPTATNAALGALTAERSGSGSAVISALRQVGATIGVAVLGTVLTSGYRSHLVLTGLSAAAASSARSGVTAGVTVAQAAHSPALLAGVRAAFVHGLAVMLWICGGIALGSAILGLLFLPRRGATSAPEPVVTAASNALEGVD